MKGFILFVSLFGLAVAEAPKELTLCRPNDPNLEQCLQKLTDDVVHILNEGVPEYNIPAANPINAPDFVIGPDPQYTIINFAQQYSNVQIFNFPLSKMTLVNSSLQENSFSFALRITNPLIKTTAKFYFPSFSFQGQTVVDLSGNATILIDTNCLVTATGTNSENNGTGYLEIKELVLDSDHKSITLDLHSENQEVVSNLSNFLAMNQQTVIEESKSRVDAYFGPILRELVNTIFLRIPLKY